MANTPVSQIDPVTKRRVPAPRPRRPRTAASIVLSLGIGFMVLALVVLGGLVAVYFSDLTLPGVQAMGIDLGGQTAEQAAATLQAEWDRQPVVVSTGDKSWSIPPSQLGLMLDADAMVQQAHAQGRSRVSLERLWQGGVKVDPIWHFDRVRADGLLQMLAPQVQVDGQSANVRITGGLIEQTPAVMGRALDTAATLRWLDAHAAQALETRKLDLITMPVAPAIVDVGPAVEQARTLLSASRTIELYDALKDEHVTWTIPSEMIGGWLTLHLNPEDQHWLAWTVDQAQVEAYLTKQSATLGDLRYVKMETALPAVMDLVQKPGPAIKMLISHREQQHVVKAGETISSIASDVGIPYPWIQQANPDLGDYLRAGQSITIPSPDVMLPLPPVENKRIIVSIGSQTVQAFENGKLKWQWQGSTGIASSPTAPGIYQIRSHEPNAYAANWNLWMPWFMGIYQPVPGNDFMNGFHGFPSRGGTQLLWTNNLGRPVTYGCILVSTDNAKALYDWAQEGVVVEIRK